MDKARIVVMAAKTVRGRERRMKAGARVIKITSVIIFAAMDCIGIDSRHHLVLKVSFLHVTSEAIKPRLKVLDISTLRIPVQQHTFHNCRTQEGSYANPSVSW